MRQTEQLSTRSYGKSCKHLPVASQRTHTDSPLRVITLPAIIVHLSRRATVYGLLIYYIQPCTVLMHQSTRKIRQPSVDMLCSHPPTLRNPITPTLTSTFEFWQSRVKIGTRWKLLPWGTFAPILGFPRLLVFELEARTWRTDRRTLKTRS